MSRALIVSLCLAVFLSVELPGQEPIGQEPTGQEPTVTPKTAESTEQAKHADIRRLLELTGSGALGKQVVDQMIRQFRGVHSGVPDRFWNEFADGLSTDDLVEMTVPIYDKHLTHEDIRQLISFYESPVGKKMIRVQPLIVRDSMQVGAKWGQEVARKAVEKLQAEGFTPPAR